MALLLLLANLDFAGGTASEPSTDVFPMNIHRHRRRLINPPS